MNPDLEPPTVLSLKDIIDAITEECIVLNGNQQIKNQQASWSFRRAELNDLVGTHTNNKSLCTRIDPTLLFGVVAFVNDTVNSDDSTATATNKEYLATFYMAYSTWDGRVLYLDEFNLDKEYVNNHDSKTPLSESDLPYLLRRLLCRIAVRLHCSRCTWQHYGDDYTYPGSIQSVTLHGWVALHWFADDMISFLQQGNESSPSHISSSTNATILDSSQIRDCINVCLETQLNARKDIRIRLATESDVDTIGRLVHGLAVFEEMPDEVHITTDYYLNDGFKAEKPLFFCLLLDYTKKDGTVYTFGMAFCYIGYSLQSGMFVYLEDLFIEQEYRDKGCGKLTMVTLASLSLSLGCSKMVWSALDWNAPALAFYEKIGAKLQHGVLTTRFANESLREFSN